MTLGDVSRTAAGTTPPARDRGRRGDGRRSGLGLGLGLGPAAVVLALLTACSSATASGAGNSATVSTAGSGSAAAPIPVVTSTNVWGAIAAQIGGSAVAVTSFISDPNQDPHSYEASARNQLAVAQARLVVENGGGYDDFMDTMLSAAHSRATVINAVTVSGFTAPAGGDLNEHVWYDFPTVGKVAAAIEKALAGADPARASTFSTNLAALDRQLTALEGREATIKSAHAGAAVAITEPVPLYLLAACGLTNLTPPAFSEAIENGSDVAPAVLQQTLKLFDGKQVKALVYNEQTAGAENSQVVTAAQADHIPVVPVTETMPPGDSYIGWMGDNLTALGQALG